MAFRPLHDKVLIKRVDSDTRTLGGLFIPDSAKEKPQRAEIVAVGAGKRMDDGSVREPSVKVGDIVLFGKYVGDEIKLDGVEHIILSESDILAVIEE